MKFLNCWVSSTGRVDTAVFYIISGVVGFELVFIFKLFKGMVILELILELIFELFEGVVVFELVF